MIADQIGLNLTVANRELNLGLTGRASAGEALMLFHVISMATEGLDPYIGKKIAKNKIRLSSTPDFVSRFGFAFDVVLAI